MASDGKNLNLSSLVHELREKIAAGSSSTPTTVRNSAGEEDVIVNRFRAVIPNLLNTYVLPSSENDREVTAVVKLVAQTAKNFPEVFYYGSPGAIFPIIGRIMPFFAEPTFIPRHGVLVETVGSLLALLRSKSRDGYRMFFYDAMSTVEKMLNVAYLRADDETLSHLAGFSLKCFPKLFSGVWGESSRLCDLPDSNKPTEGTGIVVDLLESRRWQAFATCIIKLICRCLTEGTQYVEGLIHTSSVTAACSLICYGDADLQMACFDFVRIVGSVISFDIVPYTNVIESISILLSSENDRLPIFRNVMYDTSMGCCLMALYSSCSDDVVKSTAGNLVSTFAYSLTRTKSLELKAALCNAYVRIVKSCPSRVWRPEILVQLLVLQEPCYLLIDCFRASLSVLGPDCIGKKKINSDNIPQYVIDHQSRVGRKRNIEDTVTSKIKRQKVDDSVDSIPLEIRHTQIFANEMEETLAYNMREALMLTIEILKPISDGIGSTEPEFALTALNLLCLAFYSFPISGMPNSLFHQTLSWIPRIAEKVEKGDSISFDVSIFLEGFYSMLLFLSCFSNDNHHLIREVDYSNALLVVLKLPWTNPRLITINAVTKAKCITVRILSMLGPILRADSGFYVFDLALLDESEEVRAEAIISMPLIVFWSGFGALSHILKRLEFLSKEENLMVKKILPHSLGLLSCLHGSCTACPNEGLCQLLLNKHIKQGNTVNYLLQGFRCSMCDKSTKNKDDLLLKGIERPDLVTIEMDYSGGFVILQSLYFKLIFDESFPEVQLACVQVIHRILGHTPIDVLCSTRSEWIKCFKFLLLNRNLDIREAFCSQIGIFIQDPILNCLFKHEDSSEQSCEKNFMNMIEHALTAAKDHLVLETLLETVAEIMVSVDISCKLFSFSFFLLINQLDHPHVTVRLNASRLISQSCYFHVKGGCEILLAKAVHIRHELFAYLSLSLASRPNMIRDFSEGVLGVELKDLVKEMIPVVLPNLLVSQQANNQAADTLYELAKLLRMDVLSLIVNWLPKVLAFALHLPDETDLISVLQYYHTKTGSNNQEIFAAALPALLDELVCFVDVSDTTEINRRLERVPHVIKKISRVLTNSEDLAEFLKNHFVGLLNSIDRKLLHAEDASLQRQTLKRIKILIKMMGRSLSTYVPKLMVLLMHAIGKEALQHDGLSELHFFIQKLAEVSPFSTKHIISQIFAALIPFLEREKEGASTSLEIAVKILEELVLNNRIILKQHICEFPLLPNIPALAEVNNAIQEARGLMPFKDQLVDIVHGLKHENLNVRYMVACELSKLLDHRREDIAALINGEIASDMDTLSYLIASLLRGCAEESRTAVGQRLKLVCADCLGALGAVDPAKLRGNSSQRFKIQCSDDDLIFELIHSHLARAFRAAPDTIVQDSAALAIQELLKIAGCEASLAENIAISTSEVPKGKRKVNISNVNSSEGRNQMNNSGQRLWDRFSNYVKEIIAPCLTSRFQLPHVSDSKSSGPIYRPSLSCRRWLFYWIRKLIADATGSRASIFAACRGIVRHDMQTATYLLPYLVLDVVCHGTEEARLSIAEEILSVLDAAASDNSGASVHGIYGGQSEVCVQAVFTLLDNLGQWVDDVKQDIALAQSSLTSTSKQTASKLKDCNATSVKEKDELLAQCKNVSELLHAIPKVTLARSSFRCQAYARSLMYFESYVRGKSGSFNPAAEKSGIFEDEDVSYLMEIYGCLDEPDGLSGLACLCNTMSLQDKLLINKKSGNWAEVLSACEQALQVEHTSVQRHSDVLNCLLNMCHLQAMVIYVDGLISRTPQYRKTWCMQGIQAAWRLGRWDLMEEYLQGAEEEGLTCSTSESNASFDMDVAKILQAMMKKDQFLVAERIALSKNALIAPMAAAGMDSYARAYPFIVKLHMLRELEDFHSLLAGGSFLEKTFDPRDPIYSKAIQNWVNRIGFTQSSLWAREPLLAFRRLVFGASGLSAQVGNCWLQYAKLCRLAGHYETANRAILEAQSCDAPNVHVEKAKLLWSTRRTDSAIIELQQSLLNMPVEVVGSSASFSISNLSTVPVKTPPLACNTQASNANRDVAKTLLLYSKWIHYTGLKQKEDITRLYTRVRELQPKWEKGFFYMAKYCDEVLVDARKRQEESSGSSKRRSSGLASNMEKRWWFYMPEVLLFYAKGLHRGHKNLFQALPRLLTLWFEFGNFYQVSGSAANKDLKNIHAKVMKIMQNCAKDLPTYQWLTVLPQLVSRICHQNEETVKMVKQIITSVLRQYPQQGLWIMAAVSKSTVPARREAAAEIIQVARKGCQGDGGNTLFVQFASLIDHLVKLCFHGGQPRSKTINISTEFSALKRMMPLNVIMPVQQSLAVSQPALEMDNNESLFANAFSGSNLPTISGIADEAEILSSLQRPKKIVLLGSDGVERPFLCKPKDDLRKDARMMEFNAMINRLLSKYLESRRRKLYIRTFAVIPLTEDCGMIEWVPHTRGLRHIIQDIYISCGNFDRHRTNPEIKKIYDQCAGKMPEDEMLKNMILPKFPPVFHKWFLTMFSEPAAWFRARTAYAHTTAVWSMVGHIVGLGDRHGENILFDSTTGDCVHVDFSCLFDKGLQLEKPELVPFRLTQNIIDGLGITGYEGVFMRVCEITLTVLRTHRETLMNVLETFIHDPLVEWTKSHKSSGVEVQNPHAQRAISNIEARLRGVVVGVGAEPSLPLAVEGQARRLIAEAVSFKNLGKMYIWWMPWF